ncbi:hypothetical protein UlMin_013299 [Ulmus minor]
MAEEHVNDFSIKVYVDAKKNRVVYAECGGDFVDVLLSFLTTPLGTIVSLARSQSLPTEMGCLRNLYTTVENMDVQNFHSRACKTMLLEPRNSAENHCMNLKLKVDDTLGIKYCCSSDKCTFLNYPLVSHYSDEFCGCGKSMNRKVTLSQESKNVGGSFVKEDIGFIITDDLQVLRVSSNVCFSLYSKLGIMDRRTLDVRSLNVGANEIVNLLICSFVSKSTLSETFLKCKPAPEFINPILFPERSIDQSQRFEDLKINQENSVTLKLMISKSKKKVCYAEADMDFVNLLFNFLTVPLGHVVKKIQNSSFNGCVNLLYKSVQVLDEHVFKDKNSEKMVLRSSLALGCWYRNDLLGIEKSVDVSYYYALKNRFPKIYSAPPCSSSGVYTFSTMNSTSPTDGGFLRGHKMFIVTDKLVIAPISSELCFSILEEMKVHFTDIEEKIVKVNRELVSQLISMKSDKKQSYSPLISFVMPLALQALRLLVTSFVSESALTNVFV